MEQNPELQKLLKLKEALKSDLEKKTGRKIEPKEEKKQKIQISEDLKKRIVSDVNFALNLDEIRTPLDIEKSYTDADNQKLFDYVEKNAETVRDKILSENLKSMMDMLKGRFQEAVRSYESLYIAGRSDFLYFNLLLAGLFSGDEIEKGLASFLAEQPRSNYPLLMMFFYSIFRYKSFQITKKTIPLLLKAEPNEQQALFFQMLQIDDKEISKYSSILYRKNEYKEYQNIVKLLPFYVNKDATNYKYTLDALSKKESHRCSRVYYEYVSQEKGLGPGEKDNCPLGIFIAGRKALQINDFETAQDCASQLTVYNDPYGQLLKAALGFGSGKISESTRLLHELLLPFEKVIITWLSGKPVACKGVGILANPSKTNTIVFPIPSDFEQFQRVMNDSLTVWDDFEVYLYPYEEYRCFFGSRLCTLAYKEKK